jgi:hypothetical protein
LRSVGFVETCAKEKAHTRGEEGKMANSFVPIELTNEKENE